MEPIELCQKSLWIRPRRLGATRRSLLCYHKGKRKAERASLVVSPVRILGSTRCRSRGYFFFSGATAGSSVKICARAATGGEDLWQLRRRSSNGVLAFPVAAAPLSDRVWVLRWGIVAADEPRVLSSQSPPPLYRLRDGGPPASSWAGPRLGCEVKGPVGRWANWWRSIPTFSPLISSYTFTFISFTSFYISSQINA